MTALLSKWHWTIINPVRCIQNAGFMYIGTTILHDLHLENTQRCIGTEEGCTVYALAIFSFLSTEASCKCPMSVCLFTSEILLTDSEIDRLLS